MDTYGSIFAKCMDEIKNSSYKIATFEHNKEIIPDKDVIHRRSEFWINGKRFFAYEETSIRAGS